MDNNQIGKNISLISVIVNIIWNAIICTIHFFLSITKEDYSYEYGTPSMSFFMLFSVIEIRLLFFVFRAKNFELLFDDMRLFKKKLFRLYIYFCKYILNQLDIALFECLLLIKYIFTNFWLSYMLFIATWLFQIIHNAMSGSKPPMSYYYILVMTAGKAFFPVFYKLKLALLYWLPI